MRAVNVARSPVIVHLDVAPFHPTHVLQRFPERRNAGLSLWIALGKAHQHTDPPHPAGLLRAHRERPNARCDAQTPDEISTIKPTARHVFPHVADRHRLHHTTKTGAGPWLILKCSESSRRSAVAASRGVRI